MLTTHRMDEAEQLCDKIAIMINGRFVVYGSPSFLRNKYGQGYQISVTQKNQLFQAPETSILNRIRQYLPYATVEYNGIVNGQHPSMVCDVEVVFSLRAYANNSYKLSEIFGMLSNFMVEKS